MKQINTANKIVVVISEFSYKLRRFSKPERYTIKIIVEATISVEKKTVLEFIKFILFKSQSVF